MISFLVRGGYLRHTVTDQAPDAVPDNPLEALAFSNPVNEGDSIQHTEKDKNLQLIYNLLSEVRTSLPKEEIILKLPDPNIKDISWGINWTSAAREKNGFHPSYRIEVFPFDPNQNVIITGTVNLFLQHYEVTEFHAIDFSAKDLLSAISFTHFITLPTIFCLSRKTSFTNIYRGILHRSSMLKIDCNHVQLDPESFG